MVTVPGSEGYMGVMAGHAPLVSTLRAGMIDMLDEGVRTPAFSSGAALPRSIPAKSRCWPRKRSR